MLDTIPGPWQLSTAIDDATGLPVLRIVSADGLLTVCTLDYGQDATANEIVAMSQRAHSKCVWRRPAIPRTHLWKPACQRGNCETYPCYVDDIEKWSYCPFCGRPIERKRDKFD